MAAVQIFQEIYTDMPQLGSYFIAKLKPLILLAQAYFRLCMATIDKLGLGLGVGLL